MQLKLVWGQINFFLLLTFCAFCGNINRVGERKMSNRLNFSKVYKKSSNREVREETNDYSHIRRGAIFSAVAGITYGFSKLSNTMAVGRWGHTLFAWSTAGMVYLGADAVLSAAEIGVNKTKYFSC